MDLWEPKLVLCMGLLDVCQAPGSHTAGAGRYLAERGGKKHGGSLIRSGFGKVNDASHNIITAVLLQSDRPIAFAKKIIYLKMEKYNQVV
ncbi:hypothetical protein WISP_96425 [Willisornis vidua]|uniref:Uncharacterized protein n=1 Tax=Willisornis vidua TaxID=1566151 RepID=A0ABQ9CZK8_9PASS|nr:hypothetical protein WISP_96425 [Willisornis vidua]